MTQPAFFDGLSDGFGGDSFSAREALLGWMQDVAPYGILTTDREFRVRSWNHWLALHSGMAPDTVIGRPLFEVFPDLLTRRLDEHFKRALQGEVSMLSTALHRYLLRFPSVERDPSMVHMLQTVRIAPLPAGDMVLGTITFIEDVTQRELQANLLQRQQEHDRVLSSALSVLLKSADPIREVVALFPKITLPLGFEVYFNYVYDEKTRMLQLNAASGILPSQKELIATNGLGEGLCGECARTRTPVLQPRLQESKDEAGRLLRSWGIKAFCCFPLVVGERLLGALAFASSTRDTLAPDVVECLATVARYFSIAIDRARRDKALDEAQRSLLEHAVSLESKVAERTARLQETIAELESFSYTVAHDLRAPIRALRGYTDALLADYTLPDSGVAMLRRLQRASDRLDALTRDLLTYTKITRQFVNLETVDVAEVLADIQVMSPTLHEGGVLTIASELPKVRAQRTLLQQCLSNLFDNALKFVAPGTKPRIVVRAEPVSAPSRPATDSASPFNPTTQGGKPPEGAPHEGETGAERRWVRLRIEDNGIGIASEMHQKIFGIFERVNGARDFEGTGIGLAIVARAMAKMNGAYGVESAPGEGSCFWLELPLADETPVAATDEDNLGDSA